MDSSTKSTLTFRASQNLRVPTHNNGQSFIKRNLRRVAARLTMVQRTTPGLLATCVTFVAVSSCKDDHKVRIDADFSACLDLVAFDLLGLVIALCRDARQTGLLLSDLRLQTCHCTTTRIGTPQTNGTQTDATRSQLQHSEQSIVSTPAKKAAERMPTFFLQCLELLLHRLLLLCLLLLHLRLMAHRASNANQLTSFKNRIPNTHLGVLAVALSWAASASLSAVSRAIILSAAAQQQAHSHGFTT